MYECMDVCMYVCMYVFFRTGTINGPKLEMSERINDWSNVFCQKGYQNESICEELAGVEF